jgi:uncharacterized membrane protein YobD (UPF0266 family)
MTYYEVCIWSMLAGISVYMTMIDFGPLATAFLLVELGVIQ